MSSKRSIALTALIACLVSTLALFATSAEACTAFLLEEGGRVLVGKSYDWHTGTGLVVINKRGVKKKALALLPGDKPLSWESRYGSVTFNQYGREFPNGGMNEEGLVIEALWLRSSSFPTADARPSVNELQWIQHHLDRYKTVREVVASAHKLRISRVHGDVHYMVCDKGGACAVFEYLGGELVVKEGAATLANNPVAESERHTQRLRDFRQEPPAGTGSLARYARASIEGAAMVKAKGVIDTDDAFALLDSVKNGSSTRWHIVYEPAKKRVHWRSREATTIKTVVLGAFAMSCVKPVKVLDLNAKLEGDVSGRFEDYTRAANRVAVEASFSKLPRSLPKQLSKIVVGYPDGLGCGL